MVEHMSEMIEACEIASQLEMENDKPITFKELLPILEELRTLRSRCKFLTDKLNETIDIKQFALVDVLGLGDSPEEDGDIK